MTTSLILVILHLSLWIQDNHAFSVKKVVIRGASLLEPQEILQAARVDGQVNVMHADVRTIEQHLSQLPEVKDVRVSRIFPSSLRIEIEERRPVALLIDNGIWGIDADGILLPRFRQGFGYDYPVITGFRLKKHVPGKRIKNEKLVMLAKFVGELQAAQPGVYALISEITMNELSGITFLTVEHNLPVILGTEQLLKRCRKFEAAYQYLLSVEKIQKIKYVDLRFDGQVIAKRKA